MKKFKDLFEDSPAQDYQPNKEGEDDETKTYKPRSKGEEDFANMHMVTKTGHPVALDHQFTGKIAGNPDDHVGGKKHAKGEDNPVMQGSSKIKESFKSLRASLQTESNESLDEGVVDTLKKIKSRKQAMPVKFKNNKTLKVDLFTANQLLSVHDALKPANAKKFRDSLEKGESSFMTMVDFAMQNA